MKMANMASQLKAAWSMKHFVCVGIDPDAAIIAPDLWGRKLRKELFDFCSTIINRTSDHVAAYKFNYWFFAQYGSIGTDTLEDLIELADTHGVLTILDCKFNEIGNSAECQAAMAYDLYGADAVTLNPYMGIGTPYKLAEGVSPFFRKDGLGGGFMLTRTSNADSSQLQTMGCGEDQVPLFLHIAGLVDGIGNPNLGLVTGATFAQDMGRIRDRAPKAPLLIPGIGKQGGALEQSVRAARDDSNAGFIVNSSRGIIYASTGSDFAEQARQETIKLNDQINAALQS